MTNRTDIQTFPTPAMSAAAIAECSTDAALSGRDREISRTGKLPTNEGLAARHRADAIYMAGRLALAIKQGDRPQSSLDGWRARIKASVTLWKRYRATAVVVPVQYKIAAE